MVSHQHFHTKRRQGAALEKMAIWLVLLIVYLMIAYGFGYSSGQDCVPMFVAATTQSPDASGIRGTPGCDS